MTHFMALRRLVLSVLLVLPAACLSLRAQSPAVFDLLRSDPSARAAAMGGTFVSIAGDPAAITVNPASIATIDSSQASLSFFKHVLDINSGTITAGGEIEGIGRVGAALTFTDYGSFDRVDREFAQVQGTFGANDMILTLGWGTDLGEGFRAGVAGKAIYASLADSSSVALAVDGGLMYIDTARRVQVGLSILNLGAQVSRFGGDENEPMPIDMKVGVSHQLRGLPLLIGVNFHRLLDEYSTFFERFASFSVGGEFTLSRPLRLRIGYNNRVREDVPIGSSKGVSGFSAGLGIVIAGYRIDYGFNSLDRLGGLHRVSVNLGW